MTDSVSKPGRFNRPLLLLILLLDLIGFSLIFPIIPELLEFYTKGGAPHFWIDQQILHALDWLTGLLPHAFQNEANRIVLLGGILASIYSFLQFLFTPLWGKLSDRIGRRPVLLITSMGLAASYSLWFVSSTFSFFVLSRVLGGLMAGNLGVASASMADMSKPEERTKAMGMLGAAFGLGFIIGPGIGGITASWDLSELFPGVPFLHPFSTCALVSVVLSGGSAILNLLFFHETLEARLLKKEPWMGPLKALRLDTSIPGYKYLLFINFLFLFIFSGFEFSLSFVYKLSFHLEPATIGFVFFYSGLIIVFGQGFLIRKLSGKIPEKWIALAGISMMPLPIILLPLSAPNFYLSLLWLFFISLGASLIQPALSGMASLMADQKHQGVALGGFRSAGSLARAVGPISGAGFYWTFGDQSAYAILGSLMLLTLVFALALKNIPVHKPKNSG